MKILLFGDFSALHTNLKKGLVKSGHDVVLVTTGDSFKKLDGDIKIGSNVKYKPIRHFIQLIQYIWLLTKIRKYDVVQLISDAIIIMPPYLKILYIKILKKQNKCVILNRCGADPYSILFLIGHMRYSPYKNELKEGLYNGTMRNVSVQNAKKSIKILNTFNGILSVQYEYHVPHIKFKNYYGFVPMSVPVEKEVPANTINGKIKILYGILRREAKGHTYIDAALKKIEIKYSDSVEVIRVERIPFNEYQVLLSECNILIDQACTYGFGMNALFALAKGKVVFSGNEPEEKTIIKEDIPVVNIKPSADDIYDKLEHYITNPDKITEIGSESHKYVMKVHDSDKVARLYTEKYEKIIR